jgi:hypothetical protein
LEFWGTLYWMDLVWRIVWELLAAFVEELAPSRAGLIPLCGSHPLAATTSPP